MATRKSNVPLAGKEASSAEGAERGVVVLIGAWVLIQPWLMGGVFWWSEAFNTIVGVLALVVGLRTREARRSLWRFPVFWLGLLFCAYLLCQLLNPWGYAVQRVPGLLIYDVYTFPHFAWLPSGLWANYFDPGAWRTFIYWLGPWLIVCAWWVAVRRRRTGRRLELALFINGVVMALVVVVERFHPSGKLSWLNGIPGFRDMSLSYGGFVDHNKTAAFLYLSMGAGLALACHLQAKARERGRDNGLAWVTLFGCLIILGSFFSLGSRAGLAVAGGVFLAGFATLLGTAFLAQDRSPGLWLGSLVLLMVVAGWGYFEFSKRDSGTLFRIKYLSEHQAEDTRGLLRKETMRMIHLHPWLGWGGGTYRYVSPDFFIEDYIFNDPTYDTGLKYNTDWAHSDWLQLPMEFGVVGAGLLLAILLYLYGRALWLLRRLGAEGLMVLLAAGGMLAHAAVDFPTYNAAVLLVFCLLLTAMLKTAELEAKRSAKA